MKYEMQKHNHKQIQCWGPTIKLSLSASRRSMQLHACHTIALRFQVAGDVQIKILVFSNKVKNIIPLHHQLNSQFWHASPDMKLFLLLHQMQNYILLRLA